MKKTKEKSVDLITTTIKTDKWYTATGTTLAEAILKLKPFSRIRGILVVSKGELKREKVLSPAVVNRLFGPGGRIAKEIALKQVLALFDGF